jgi:hypothetical protein
MLSGMASLGAALCLTRRLKPIGLYLKHRNLVIRLLLAPTIRISTNMLYMQTELSPPAPGKYVPINEAVIRHADSRKFNTNPVQGG